MVTCVRTCGAVLTGALRCAALRCAVDVDVDADIPEA